MTTLSAHGPSVAFLPTSRTLTADDYLRDQSVRLYRRTDVMFAILLLAEWVACCLWAIFASPYTYNGLTASMHPHVMTSLFFGGLISLFPCFLVINAPSIFLTRHMIAVAQMLMSSLIIHISGGRLETHFHIFGSLAFLAFYRDWKVLITATFVVVADHFFRGIYYPQSVYGIATASISRTLEHFAWILFENIFLIYACLYSRREMQEIAAHRAQQDQINARIENQVRLRTEELNELTRLLQRQNLELETKHHQVEIERQAALTASRAKANFLTNMSHELRTPLTAILGYAEIILEPEDHDVIRQAGLTIKRNGQHLLTLLNDILDLSKIEANKLQVEFEPCSPVDLVSDVIELLKVRADEKHLKLEAHFQQALPALIDSDETRLRQILLNLLGNAIKFTSKGRILIDVHTSSDEETIYFDVIDTGIGIPPEHQARLFGEFEQADASTTRQYGGTGLGLAIVRRLARLLHGEASLLRSVPGAGSTFRVELPIASTCPDLIVHANTQLIAAN